MISGIYTSHLNECPENLPVDEIISTREIKFTKFHQRKVNFVDLYSFIVLHRNSIPSNKSSGLPVMSSLHGLHHHKVNFVGFFFGLHRNSIPSNKSSTNNLIGE